MNAIMIIGALTAATLGGLVCIRLKISAGALIGSIVAVGTLRLFDLPITFAPMFRTVIGSMAGTYLGCQVNRNNLHQLKAVIVPAFITVLCMLAYTFFESYFLAKFTNIDITTALLSTTPGGITEMSIIASDFGVNPATVSMIQLLRLIIIIIVTPTMIKRLLKKRYKDSGAARPEQSGQYAAGEDIPFNLATIFCSAVILLVGVLIGLLGKQSGLPAGSIWFPIVTVAALNVLTGKAALSKRTRNMIQGLNGASIGARLVLADLLVVMASLPCILAVIAGWIVLNLLLGRLLHRRFNLSVETALFATSAAGVNDMGIIAAEMGGDAAQVSAIQLSRLISVIVLYPSIIKWITCAFAAG